MSLADFFDRIGTNFSNNLSDAGPQGLASLGAAIASAPRRQWGAGLAQGLGGMVQTAQAERKKRSLADALQGAMGGMSPQQQAFAKALIQSDPSQAASLIGGQLFKGNGDSWTAKDIDGDGKFDVQVQSGSGKVETYPLSYKDRAYNMMFESGVSPIAPGVGVDNRGNVVPMPGGADPQSAPAPAPAAPQLRPSMAPPAGPLTPEMKTGGPMATMETAPQPAAPVVSAPPNNASPDPVRAQAIPLSGDALKRMNLGQAEAGKQWALDPKTLRPVQIPVPGGSPKPTEAQQKAGYLYTEMKGASQLSLNDPKQLAAYMSFWNGAKRESSKTEFLQSPDAQVYRTAGQQWVTNMLYLKSGAQAGPVEIANNEQIYIPQWGDDPARVKYKQQIREVAEAALSSALTPEQKEDAQKIVDQITAKAKKDLGVKDFAKEDIAHTAKKYGISEQEVIRRLQED